MGKIKYSVLLFLFLLVNLGCACKNNTADIWGDNGFEFVLYDGLTSGAALPIQATLEKNGARIKTDMNVLNTGTYTVHLWGKNENYLAAQEKFIGRSYPGSAGYVLGPDAMGLLNGPAAAGNAVHEYAHSMSLHVQGSFGNNPRWLWEAVAIYESAGFVHPNNISYLVAGDYPSLSDLNSDYNNSSRKIYEVGYLLIEFMKQKWGMNAVIELIKQTGNIQGVLNIPTSEFEAQWKQFIEKKYFGR